MGMNTGDRQTASPQVELHIEELVLHGFPARDRHRIGAAIERELGRLLVERGVDALTSRDVQQVNAGSFQLAMNASPQTVGRHVAQRVYTQLSSTTIPAPAKAGGDRHV